MSIWQILITLVAVFSIICAIAVIFFERKNPASSIAWVLVLLFLPGIGVIAYLFLATGFRITKRRRYALKAANDNLYGTFLMRNLDLELNSEFMNRFGNYSRLLTYLENETEGIFTDNNAAEVFTDGNVMFPRLLDDLRQAKDHIHLLFYIFRNDELGREIVSILADKARQGVAVRLIYDSVGSMLSFDPIFKDLKKAGGQVLGFSPIFSTLSSHLRLNYRNHRKIVVIDGQIGYVGGMNVGVEYMGRNKKLTPWRDTHLRLTGSAVLFLQERFMMDWSYTSESEPTQVDIVRYFPEPVKTGNLGVQIVSSGPDTFESPLKSGLVSMLYSAKNTIYIQTPYFTPDGSFFDAIRIAAHSNIDVRLMIPKLGDYDIVQRATLGYVREALGFGVRVFMYRGFIHSKTMTVDGSVATIGTCNLTNRSFTLDFEVNAFIYDQEFAKAHEAIFLRDQEASDEIDSRFFTRKSLITRATYNFARLLAPMM